MKQILSSVILISGLFLLTKIEPRAQTTLPPTCIQVLQTTNGITIPNCLNPPAIVPLLPPVQGPQGPAGPQGLQGVQGIPGPAGPPGTGTTGTSGGPCTAPGTTPPSVALYAQDPTTKVCYPIIVVADPNFVASVAPSGSPFWYLPPWYPVTTQQTWPKTDHWPPLDGSSTYIAGHN